MLHFIKRGCKLEEQELKNVLGSYFGNCGTYGCDNCGECGNDATYEKVYNSWWSEILE
jgi:hypothetical protein